MHSLAQGAEWLDGYRFAGGASKDSVKEWIESLGLNFTNSKEVSKMKVQIGNAVFTATLERACYDNERSADHNQHERLFGF